MNTSVIILSWFALLATFSPALAFWVDQAVSASELSSEEEKQLKRRFWNDDLEACILKYCLAHQNEGYAYVRCIRKHCPAGLVAVPREIEADDFPSVHYNGIQVLCAELLCGQTTSGADLQQCIQAKCRSGEQGVRKTALAAPSRFHFPGASRMSNNLRDILRNLCVVNACAGKHGKELFECAREQCGGRSGSKSWIARAQPEVDDHAATDDADELIEGLLRKRRINDELSQCIESYCSDKSNGDRIVCIRDACHRPGR